MNRSQRIESLVTTAVKQSSNFPATSRETEEVTHTITETFLLYHDLLFHCPASVNNKN